MMPQVVRVRVGDRRGRRVRLWIPLLPVALVLSPVVLLGLAVAAIACLAHRIQPVRAFAAGWRVLCALTGTRIDIEQGHTVVLVSIS